MNFKERKVIFVGIIGAIIVCLLGLTLPFILHPEFTLLENIGLAQLSFSAIAFFAVFTALVIAIVQFRKSMAKPLIKVAFNEKGEQQATLIYKDIEFETGLPILWLINKGNAVARYFQIDFIIPENIGKPSAYVPLSKDDGNYILSYINEGRYTLFVNRPYSDPNMLFSSAFNLSKCIELNVASFKIKYKVYGDWAETQKGELKVTIKKRA